jgi:hypothetical protein
MEPKMTDETYDTRLFDSTGNAVRDEPVFLSGGELGGHIVPGEGWQVDEERVFLSHRYRRVERQTDPQNVNQAVFSGIVDLAA